MTYISSSLTKIPFEVTNKHFASFCIVCIYGPSTLKMVLPPAVNSPICNICLGCKLGMLITTDVFSISFLKLGMNVYPGNVPKSDPHCGWMSIILHLSHLCVVCFSKKRHFWYCYSGFLVYQGHLWWHSKMCLGTPLWGKNILTKLLIFTLTFNFMKSMIFLIDQCIPLIFFKFDLIVHLSSILLCTTFDIPI